MIENIEFKQISKNEQFSLSPPINLINDLFSKKSNNKSDTKTKNSKKKTNLHNENILQLTSEINKNFKAKYPKDFDYEKNLEIHIHKKLNNLIQLEKKLKKSWSLF